MSASDEITCADKCTDIREKIGKVCIVVKGMSPCGDFQLTTAKVRGHDLKTWKSITPALGQTYEDCMRQWGTRLWLVYEETRISFKQGEEIMVALAAQLQKEFDIKKGDKVGIAMRNFPEFLLAFLGITYMGGVAVPLNSLWKTDEFEYAVKDSEMKVLIGDPERLQVCQPFLGRLGVKSIIVRGTAAQKEETGAQAAWEDMIAAGKQLPRPSYKNIDFEDDAMIMYTSGSTGFPKGVVHTQRSVGACMKLGKLAALLTPEEESKALMAVPMFHITALGNTCLFSLPAGNAILMMRKWDAGEALKMIEKEKATRFTGVPTMVRDMFEHPNFKAEAFASMKNIAAGGAPVPPSLMAKVRKAGSKPAQGYGLTETMGAVAINNGVDYKRHPTSCGKPIPLVVQAAIKDPATGKTLKDGERGELCIKSHFNMKGYQNRPEDTAKVIDSEGFFHTGDIAKMEGGFIFILDRLKDIIIRGGENIDCSEVETCLYAHPKIRECSVFGLPDARLGEVVGCAVYPQPGENLTPEEINKHAAATLSKFKVPLTEHIFMRSEELPKGATGKIDKKGMRAEYAAKMPKVE